MEAITVQEESKNEIVNKNITLQEMIDKFINVQDVSEKSRNTYKRELRKFTDWLEDTNRIEKMNDLQREDILEYKRYLQDQDLSSYTISGYLTAVRKFFKWLESERIYPNIAQDIKGMKKAKGHRRDCLTPGQIKKALEQIDRSTMKGKRDYALFNLLARTGLRTIEIANAKIGDIRQESGQAVLWIKGKGRDEKDDFVLLTEKSLEPIREYLAERDSLEDDKPLFISLSNRNYGGSMTTRSISRVIKNILKEINLNSKRYTAHSLRHTAITLAIKGGASLEQAQAMARHSDPKTTMVYFHNLDRIDEGAEKCIKF